MKGFWGALKGFWGPWRGIRVPEGVQGCPGGHTGGALEGFLGCLGVPCSVVGVPGVPRRSLEELWGALEGF